MFRIADTPENLSTVIYAQQMPTRAIALLNVTSVGRQLPPLDRAVLEIDASSQSLRLGEEPLVFIRVGVHTMKRARARIGRRRE
jgi:hypothetical protein